MTHRSEGKKINGVRITRKGMKGEREKKKWKKKEKEKG